MIKLSILLTIVSTYIFLLASPVLSERYDKPIISPTSMHLAGSLKIGGEKAMSGDEVGIFDESGRIVGAFVIKKNGIFGDMAISGDDDLTDEQEGAIEGESLNIKVWQKSTTREYSGGGISISSPSEGNSIYAPYPGEVLQFKSGTFYLVNIEVGD